jgi:hypothetical protein
MSTNPLEKHLKSIARTLHDAQVCRLYKIPNDIKIAGNQLIHGEQVPVDFIGFTVTGRAMLVECKITCKPTLALGSKSGLRPHQMQALMEAQRAGAIALVVWQFGTDIAVIDADQVLAYSTGRRSVPFAAIGTRYKKRIVSNPLRFFEPFLARS